MALDPKSSASEMALPNLTAKTSILGLQPGQQLILASNNLSCLKPRGLKTRFGFLEKIIVGDKLECARKVSFMTEIKKRPTKEEHYADMLRTVRTATSCHYFFGLGQAHIKRCTVERLCNAVQEYQAFQRLGSHPNIISFQAAFEDVDSVHFITSPYCSGGTLLDRLTAETGTPVSESQLATYFKQVVEAVSWCHDKGDSASLEIWSPPYQAAVYQV